MEDFYIEQIVPKKTSAGFISMAKTGWIVITAILLLGGALTGSIILLILGAVVGICGYYFILPQLQVEYEYLYMGKEFSVDKILAKEKRKKAGSWDFTNVEMIAKYNSDALKAYENRQCDTFNFTSGTSSEACYVVMINDKKFTRLLIEPNEEMVKKFRDQFPRQFVR